MDKQICLPLFQLGDLPKPVENQLLQMLFEQLGTAIERNFADGIRVNKL